MMDDEKGHGVQAVQIVCIILCQLIAVIVGSEGPVPYIIGIVVYRVTVEGFQIINDRHPVDERLTGVVGQGGINNNYHYCQSDEHAKDVFFLRFHRLTFCFGYSSNIPTVSFLFAS